MNGTGDFLGPTTHPVLHRLLHQGETLPTRVKLVFVGTSEMHQVTDDLRETNN